MNPRILSGLLKVAPLAVVGVSVLLMAHGVHVGHNDGDPGGPGGPT